MNNKSDLLAEHAEITKELDNIRNQILVFKDITETKLKTAQSEDEISNIFVEFKSKVDKIQQDKDTKKKYKNLQRRKLEIESTLSGMHNDTNNINNCITSHPTNDVVDDIDVLIKKYKRYINVPIESPNIQYNQQMQQNQKNQYNQSQKPTHRKPNKKEINILDTEDNMQVSKLNKLIKSLKLNIDAM